MESRNFKCLGHVPTSTRCVIHWKGPLTELVSWLWSRTYTSLISSEVAFGPLKPDNSIVPLFWPLTLYALFCRWQFICPSLDARFLEVKDLVRLIIVWPKRLVKALELHRCLINYCCQLQLRAIPNGPILQD